jgi:hypothetical protein
MLHYETERVVEIKDACRILVGKHARKRLRGRFRRRWEDKIKVYPQVMRVEGVDWIFLNLGEAHLAGCSEQCDQHSSFIKIQGNS